MAFTQVTVTHSFQNIDGTAASGVVVFILSGRMTNGSVSYAPQIRVHSSLDSNGNLSQVLPANDDTATTPQGASYTVEMMLNGSTDSSAGKYTIVVPSAAPGGTVDLGTLLPTADGA